MRSQLDQLLTGYKVLNLRVTVDPGMKRSVILLCYDVKSAVS